MALFGRKQKERTVSQPAAAEPVAGKELTEQDLFDLRMMLDDLDMNAARQEGELSLIEEGTRAQQAQRQEESDQLLSLIESASAVSGEVRRITDLYDAACATHRVQMDGLYQLIDRSKHYTGITRKLQDVMEQYDRKASSLSSQLSTLQADAQAAGSGTGLEDSIALLRELQDSFSDTGTQIRTLITLLRDNNVQLSKLAGVSREQVTAIDAAVLPPAEIHLTQMGETLVRLQNESQSGLHALRQQETQAQSFREHAAEGIRIRRRLDSRLSELRGEPGRESENEAARTLWATGSLPAEALSEALSGTEDIPVKKEN